MNDFIKYNIFNKYKNIIHGSTTKLYNFENILKLHNCNSGMAIIPKQIHENKTIIVDSNMLGKGEDYYIGDSLATNNENIILVIRTADCLPIFLFNKDKNVIGLIHAGWRGLARDIISCFIKKVKMVYNTSENSFIAAIGPSINKNCYEVGEEVIVKLSNIYKNDLKTVIEKKSDIKYYLDLKLLAKNYLIKLGLKEENIEVSSSCTHCNDELFYSFRRDKGKLGNIYSMICLRP